MARVYLSFDPIEDLEALYDAQHGSDYSLVIWDLEQHFRNIWKYPTKENSLSSKGKTWVDIDEIRKKLYELKEERGLK